VSDIDECSAACDRESQCNSFSHRREKRLCVLYMEQHPLDAQILRYQDSLFCGRTQARGVPILCTSDLEEGSGNGCMCTPNDTSVKPESCRVGTYCHMDAVVTEGVCTDKDCFVFGIDYLGDDVHGVAPRKTSDALECMRQCFHHERCNNWTWVVRVRGVGDEMSCYFKTGTGTPTQNPAVISGRKRCPTPGASAEDDGSRDEHTISKNQASPQSGGVRFGAQKKADGGMRSQASSDNAGHTYGGHADGALVLEHVKNLLLRDEAHRLDGSKGDVSVGNRFQTEKEVRKSKIGENDDDFTEMTWPSEWLTHHGAEKLENSAKEAVKWKLLAKHMMNHAWAGYRNAWGADTVKPKTGTAGKSWANCAFTMVDALDTLWLMDMRKEFNNATEYIRDHLHFEHEKPVSVFETTIRELGGLLSAFALSGNSVFREKAAELGDRLLPAFRNGLPLAQVILKTGTAKRGKVRGTVLSEAGTVQLELSYLSRITRDPKYKLAGDKAMDILLDLGGRDGLLPIYVDLPTQASHGQSKLGRSMLTGRSNRASFGAMGDSYFEYLLKLWIMEGKERDLYRDAWVKSMDQAVDAGMFRAYKEVRNMDAAAVLELDLKSRKLMNKEDHLACFMGGLLMLGEKTSAANSFKGFFEWGRKITNGCYGMYVKSPSGLAPEIFRFLTTEQTLQVDTRARHYLLRPETAESIFYLFYFTGDPQYRRWAGFILEAIERHCKSEFGYSSISNTMVKSPLQTNEMESFFLAETLKYLYLTFLPNPKDLVDLDQWVFNTEAHLFPILQPRSEPRNNNDILA